MVTVRNCHFRNVSNRSFFLSKIVASKLLVCQKDIVSVWRHIFLLQTCV